MMIEVRDEFTASHPYLYIFKPFHIIIATHIFDICSDHGCMFADGGIFQFPFQKYFIFRKMFFQFLPETFFGINLL